MKTSPTNDSPILGKDLFQVSFFRKGSQLGEVTLDRGLVRVTLAPLSQSGLLSLIASSSHETLHLLRSLQIFSSPSSHASHSSSLGLSVRGGVGVNKLSLACRAPKLGHSNKLELGDISGIIFKLQVENESWFVKKLRSRWKQRKQGKERSVTEIVDGRTYAACVTFGEEKKSSSETVVSISVVGEQ